eukprot:gene11055-19913_t
MITFAPNKEPTFKTTKNIIDLLPLLHNPKPTSTISSPNRLSLTSQLQTQETTYPNTTSPQELSTTATTESLPNQLSTQPLSTATSTETYTNRLSSQLMSTTFAETVNNNFSPQQLQQKQLLQIYQAIAHLLPPPPPPLPSQSLNLNSPTVPPEPPTTIIHKTNKEDKQEVKPNCTKKRKSRVIIDNEDIPQAKTNVTRRTASFANDVIVRNAFQQHPLALVVADDESLIPIHEDMKLMFTGNMAYKQNKIMKGVGYFHHYPKNFSKPYGRAEPYPTDTVALSCLGPEGSVPQGFLQNQTTPVPAADSVAAGAVPEAADTMQPKKKKRKSKKLDSDNEEQPKTKVANPKKD